MNKDIRIYGPMRIAIEDIIYSGANGIVPNEYGGITVTKEGNAWCVALTHNEYKYQECVPPGRNQIHRLHAAAYEMYVRHKARMEREGNEKRLVRRNHQQTN